MPFMRAYGTGTGADVRVPLIKRAVVDFAVGADWTPAAGDVKLSKDGAAVANIATLPTALAAGNGAVWVFTFSDTELQCKELTVTIVDAATKAVEDQCFHVWTYGNASAMFKADLSATNLPANVTQLLGTAWLAPGVAGTPDVNAKLLGATAQTGRDVGASVLLSSGTGTGQLDFTSGVVKANLAQILGTALTETAGLLAGGFKKLFNVATPTGTLNSIPDAVAGAAGGIAIVGSNVGVATSVSGAVGSIASGGIAAASFAAGAIDAAAIATDAIGSAELAASAVTEIQSGLATAADIAAILVLNSGTVSSAASTTSVTLPAGASSVDGTYAGCILWVTGGTGSGQARIITSYTGATRNAVLAFGFSTLLDGTSVYRILALQLPVLSSVLGVDVANMGSNSINSGTLATGAITSAKFASGAINAAAIAADAIGASELAADAVTEIVDGVLAGVVEGAVTVKQSLQLNNAASAAKLSGAATATVLIRDLGDTKNRITATVDADGNRSAVTVSYD